MRPLTHRDAKVLEKAVVDLTRAKTMFEHFQDAQPGAEFSREVDVFLPDVEYAVHIAATFRPAPRPPPTSAPSSGTGTP
jgi:hypothetical protein